MRSIPGRRNIRYLQKQESFEFHLSLVMQFHGIERRYSFVAVLGMIKAEHYLC